MRRILAVLTLAPIALWLLCIVAVLALGGIAGCDIDEGSVHPCTVFGIEMGETAYTLGMPAAWGPLFFGPVFVGAGLLWAIMAIIARLRR